MRQPSRREVMAALATGALAAACSTGGERQASSPATTRPRRTEDDDRRVVVVGAGLAGLTAATDLAAVGWEVLVIEARDRVGGRQFTFRSQFEDEQVAEAGGEFIDDSHDRIQARAKNAGLSLERRIGGSRQGALIRFGGTTRTEVEMLAVDGGEAGRAMLRWQQALDSLSGGVNPDHPEAAPRAEELDGRTVASYLDDVGIDGYARQVIGGLITSEYAAAPEELSLLFMAQQEAVPAEGEVEIMRIAGGNDRLSVAMATFLGDRVRLSTPVTEIRWTADGAEVTSSAGPPDTRLAPVRCAHAVLAAPPPALRGVTFRPGLPAALAAMVAGLELGAATKTMRQVRDPFWRARKLSGQSLTDEAYRVSWDATDSGPAAEAPKGILTTFTTSAAGAQLADLGHTEQIALADRGLAATFGLDPGVLTGPTASWMWSRDVLTGGGYARWAPGQLTSWWPAVRTNAGALWFAGEHTEALAGYMESAVRSGERVARLIGQPG